ncbi:MAG TPA: AbrB/MazE/SpoVT family DNA-binding domain-containing protein [Rhodopila sp.]|jgi:antitoxin MazE
MQIGKWGNSLAVRLPSAVVDALGLREGDDIEIEVAGSRNFKIGRDHRKDDAIERLKALDWSLPPGFRFSRDEANER